MAIKLVVDSTCDMLASDFSEDFVTVMPVRVYFGKEEFIEGVNITKDSFFQKLKTEKDFPHTSQANAEEFTEVFRRITDGGDEVLGIFMSSKLSGTYASAATAQSAIGSNAIEIVDSTLVTIGLAALIEEAIRLIKEGLPLKEIKLRLDEIKYKIGFYAIVGDLSFLKKGGRLNSNLVYIIASTLHIKPILTLTEGEITNAGKALGFKRACNQVCEIINKTGVDTSRPFYIGHGLAEDMQNTLLELIKEKTSVKAFTKRRVGLSTGAHTGPDCTGVAYFKK